MIAPWRRNRLTSTLGVDYPVIQGALGGLSSQKLTAAVSNFGGLGSLGAHSLAPHAINDAIDEAVMLQESGVDAIVASGFEAGGHRGSFLRSAEDSLTGTLSLVPRIVDRVDVPVIAAGGIGDARGFVAVMALGAEAVQMGTVFLTCEESGAGRPHREALLRRDAGHTGLTRGFTGRLARGIDNALMQLFKDTDSEILPYPLQRGLVRHLSVAAATAGRPDLLPLWAGQSAGLSACTDVSAFLQSLLEEVSAIAGPVSDWSEKYRANRPAASQAR